MLVKGGGPRNAKIVIVGEAPGREEARRGIPFVGSSGRLLDEMLQRNGINRNEVYLTNIMQERPLGNDFGMFYDDPKRENPSKGLKEGTERLIREIMEIGPNVVLALGAEPLRALTNKRGIGKWRGSILEMVLWSQSGLGLKGGPGGIESGTKVVATYHPANILRKYINRTIAEMDIRRVRMESVSPDLNLPEYNLETRPSLGRVLELLKKWGLGGFEGPLAVDIETVGKRVRCIALADSSYHALCIPFMVLSHYNLDSDSNRLMVTSPGGAEYGSYWSLDDELVILKELNKVLRDENVKKVFQNLPFDSTWLVKEFGLVVKGLFIDTLAAHHACYPELPKSLDFLCSVYTRTPRYSDHNAAVDEEEWRYNCMDAAVDYEVGVALETECVEAEVWGFYKSHVEKELVAYTRAQNRGIRVDVSRRAELRTREEARGEKALARIHKSVGFDLNPSSPKQMKEYLYNTLGMIPIRHGKTKKITTEEKALLRLEAKYPSHGKFIRRVIDYRHARKLVGTFLVPELDERGRLVTTFNVSGTENGRISSSQNIFKEGVNIQQMPRNDLRSMIVAPPGCKLIKADLKQAEAMYVFWDAGIRRIIERYLDDPNFDIHTWNAAENVFKIDEELVTDEQRARGKAGVHGGNYGLGARTAAATYSVPYKDAKLAIEGYRQGLPEIKRWWDRIQGEVVSTRTLTTQFGRRRVFLGRMDNALFREAYAFRPQSTVADINNRAFYLADEQLPAGCYPLIPMHDEIVFVVKESRVDQCLRTIRSVFHYPLRFDNVPEPLVIPISVSIGDNWWDQESIE